MRIVLFTPYSPEMGGGSVQLRSHLAQLPDLDIEWVYLSNAPVPGERRRWLGKPLTSAQFAADLAARSHLLPGSTRRVKEIVSQLNADLYWVVGHYEGISVAEELTAQGKPVHLTVHDEPLAMLIRSRKFRLLYPFMAAVFPSVLRGARSVDVTSTAMRDFFERKYNVKSFALYKYLPELPVVDSHLSPGVLTVGHIGSLYHPDRFRKFVRACRRVAESSNRALKIVRIGVSPEMSQVAAENPSLFESYGELLEEQAIPVLSRCDFVYSMYPAGFRFRGFRRTSLPIKLSTYIQAQRPIFAHTPLDSGLANIVSKYAVGEVCPRSGSTSIIRAVQRVLTERVDRERFEALRAELMGSSQLHRLRSALTVEQAFLTS